MNAHQQDKPLTGFQKFQKAYFRLTHELLKNVKVNQITFSFLKIIQTMQIIHFVFREQIHGEWNSTVFKYTQMVINYISIDYLIENNPSIAIGINAVVFFIMAFVLIIMGLMMVQLGKDKKLSSILKSIVPFVNFSLFLFKTILQIPVMIIILASFLGRFQTSLNMSSPNMMNIPFASVNLLLFIVISLYLVTSFKDSNPFTDLIHAGQSLLQSVSMLLYKLLLTVYVAFDYQSSGGIIFLVCFVLLNVAMIFKKHLQIGFYKYKIRSLSIRLHYLITVFAFISAIRLIKKTDQMSMLFFLIMSYAMCYLIIDFIQKKLSYGSIETPMMFIKNQDQLECHILHLIRYIDSFEKRQSRIILQGYLAYHHRQCKILESLCICRHLIQIKQRTAQQKVQFYSFIIDILKQNLKRFMDSQRIHLLLSFIYQYRLKNRFQSIYSITRALKQSTFMNRLYFYHQNNLIQLEMIEDDSKDSSNKAVDINKFFQYNNCIVNFQQMLEDCTQKHISFWKQLLQINTDIKRLQKSGTMVTNSKEKLREQFERMLTMNPSNVHTLTRYGKFLIDVANQQPSNIKYLQKAQSILKNLKQSSKIQDAASKYTDNAQTTIVVISGNQKQLGHIIHTNNYVKQMLGYQRSECIGLNINVVMPKIFGEKHNSVLQKYLSTSSDRYNGKERIVPALGKDGYMIPVVALTKALPNLEHGIHIVGFISKLEQKPQEEEIIRKYFYLLYRSDNEQVVGITYNCYTDFHIPCCLIYGNPYNNNNELKIRNLFGFSFQKDKDGQVSTAMDTSEVVLTINTTKISQQFIITKTGTNQQIKDNLLQLDSSDFGVDLKVVAKCILSYNYRGIPLKLLSIYKYGQDCFDDKQSNLVGPNIKADETNRYFQKAENQDFKDLKDFKNFISIKSQPSAISIINNICCILIFVIASCVITFIVIWLSLRTQNELMLNATHKGLLNEIIIPNMLFQVQKFWINRDPDLFQTSFNQTFSNNRLTSMIQYIKKNERDFLPIKYAFIEQYNMSISQYNVDTTGLLVSSSTFIDQVVTLFISAVQTLMGSDMSALYSSPRNFQSNPYLLYLYAKYNVLFSMKDASSDTTNDVLTAYGNQVSIHKTVFYVLSALMLLAVIVWFFTSIPYVLSVTKINNRVLSLVIFLLFKFSLIPSHDVLKLISRCYMYMRENLSQAIVSDEDLEEILEDSPEGRNKDGMLSPNSMNMSSPATFISGGKNQSSLSVLKQKGNSNLLSKEYGQKNMSNVNVSQKFNKMINSENHQKNITILQFLLISLLLIGYIMFNHFYAFSAVSRVQLQINNIKTLGKRISILTNVKLLLTQYLMDKKLQIRSDLPSIKQLNDNIINQAYNLQSMLLKIQLDTQASTLSMYNSGNLCNSIEDYRTHSIFTQYFDFTECINLDQGILAKGLTASIVKILQQVRAILSQSIVTQVPVLLYKKMYQYELMLKYLQNPMLQIIYRTEGSVTSTNISYQLVLIICSSIFLIIIILFWRIVWMIYIEELNNKIWRTKGMLNIIPMRIITANQLLKNQFASGQLEKAVR